MLPGKRENLVLGTSLKLMMGFGENVEMPLLLRTREESQRGFPD